MSYNFELIERYFRNIDNRDSLQVLSDKTCNDLDMQELFMYLDRTKSKVGEQYLYNKLRNIPKDDNNQNLKEEIIEELTNNNELRTNTQKELSKLNKDDAYYLSSLFQEPHMKPPKWFPVVKILSVLSLISLILLPFNVHMIFVVLAIFIVNLGLHYWNKKNLYQYLGSIPQLLKLKRVAVNLNKNLLLSRLNPKLNESVKIINQVRNRMSFFQLEARLQSDFEAIVWAVLELVKTMFLLEPILLFSILKRLNSKQQQIEDLFCFVGEIDSLISIASLRYESDRYCLPIIEGNKIEAKEVYHPLIDGCVANSINVDDKSVLLTGSNMSGKTTFIRSIGVNIITGLTLNTCFAKSITIPRLKLFSAIRISDDLMNSKSYYFEEVLTIKEMISDSQDNTQSIFLLDEIFKGTNTVERIAAGKAVLSYLTKNSNIVFVSTHDIELADMLNMEYDLYHFSEKVDDQNIDFDYKLKPGKLRNRNAIKILKLNGYPTDLINEAIEISEQISSEKVPV
ncbi:MAG: DNA mismatch repair protein MutS [Bacteroidales bacterium]|jgi:DNA mismatch repair ATPase MutS|nr:DNA mismatch repair protein MutS [Bacteroidales bacterium]